MYKDIHFIKDAKLVIEHIKKDKTNLKRLGINFLIYLVMTGFTFNIIFLSLMITTRFVIDDKFRYLIVVGLAIIVSILRATTVVALVIKDKLSKSN